MNVIRSLENRGILLKGSQKGGLLDFLAPVARVTLRLMKNVLTPLPKGMLVPLGLTATVSATDAAIQKKIVWWEHQYFKIKN